MEGLQYIDKVPVSVGAHSYVYKGVLQGEMVAIKVIRPANHYRLSIQRKFKHENEVWAGLKHQNIGPLYGFAEDSTRFGAFGALILPWYENGDAEEFLKEKGHLLTMNQRVGLWCGVVAGVCYLHSQDPPIIYGNLRLGKILIDSHGIPKIGDFGLDRMLFEETDYIDTTTIDRIHSEMVRYLPYEIVTSEYGKPTTASDVYSMGCVGLAFIFLQRPYARRVNVFMGLIALDIRDGIPPATRPTPIPAEDCQLWFVLERCWALDPGIRPSAVSVLEALQNDTPLPPTIH